MVVEAFVPPVNKSIVTGIEVIKVQVAEPLNGSFLNFGIGSGWQPARCHRMHPRFVPCNDAVQERNTFRLISHYMLERQSHFQWLNNTSHFSRRPCIHQRRHLLTETSERYCTTNSIYRWRLNAALVYSI
ncbi:hypothetical protein AVEN_181612-1 [Araneus ventricosus]|uniref:Uncharacterized protein n=1 Tax=Araneus ventricosus TaxID=182803 RepID=A0A4Y2CLD2_ARAVE|nr:hypothetical protein AVEN_181612-1 [Araneus ventricosus]